MYVYSLIRKKIGTTVRIAHGTKEGLSSIGEWGQNVIFWILLHGFRQYKPLESLIWFSTYL